MAFAAADSSAGQKASIYIAEEGAIRHD